MRVAVIRAALGFEAGGFVSYRKPEATHHFIEHVIGLVAKPTGPDLQRDVPIAEVVARTCEAQWIIRTRDGDGFGGRRHAHDRTVRRAQSIAVVESRAGRENDGGLATTIETHSLSALLP
jgi:hypothetical protein